MLFFIKTIITALVIVGVSELAKRFSAFAAILAALPLTSILAMTWLYIDTKDVSKIAALSTNIFWAVLPSLIFFIVLPILLKQDFSFGFSMLISILIMLVSYILYLLVMQKFGIKI